ncbi:(2Fe-2S)-binding protein [Paenibacillus cremeus]
MRVTCCLFYRVPGDLREFSFYVSEHDFYHKK